MHNYDISRWSLSLKIEFLNLCHLSTCKKTIICVLGIEISFVANLNPSFNSQTCVKAKEIDFEKIRQPRKSGFGEKMHFSFSNKAQNLGSNGRVPFYLQQLNGRFADLINLTPRGRARLHLDRLFDLHILTKEKYFRHSLYIHHGKS